MKRHLFSVLILSSVSLFFFALSRNTDSDISAAVSADIRSLRKIEPYTSLFSSIGKVTPARVERDIIETPSILAALRKEFPEAKRRLSLEVDIYTTTQSRTLYNRNDTEKENIILSFSFIDQTTGNKIHELVRNYPKK